MSELAGDGAAQAAAGPAIEGSPRPPPLTIDGAWEPWFAWHPVRLYMSGRIAWLFRIHRRRIHRSGMAMWDYTDRPELHTDMGPQ